MKHCGISTVRTDREEEPAEAEYKVSTLLIERESVSDRTDRSEISENI